MHDPEGSHYKNLEREGDTSGAVDLGNLKSGKKDYRRKKT